MSDTIVLLHGLWMTPRSWEHWIAHYASRGHQVLAPAYPGLEVEVEALRADPSPIAALTIRDTVAHLERVLRELASPPVLMGHSFGGVLVQILLDRGFGKAGVAIHSAAPEGVLRVPPSQMKALFPVLKSPGNRRRAVPFTARQFHYAFTNTLTEQESLQVYERYHVAAPGRFIWDGALANLLPGRSDVYVDVRNSGRAPLLFIAGGDDHIMPAVVNRSNAGLYRKSNAITDYKEYPGRSHYTVGQPGWEEVADYALAWAVERSAGAGDAAPQQAAG